MLSPITLSNSFWIPGIVYVAPLSLLPKTDWWKGYSWLETLEVPKNSLMTLHSHRGLLMKYLVCQEEQVFNNICKILPIFINYLCLLLIYQDHHIPFRVVLYLLTSFPSKNYTFVYNRALMCTELFQGTFSVLKTIEYEGFLMMTSFIKHTASKEKCFIAAWAAFQPLEFSIPLSTKITTMTIKRVLLTL